MTHLKDRSVITNIMPIPEKTIKIVYIDGIRAATVDNKKLGFIHYFENSKTFIKKWNRYILKHYLITDFLELKEKRNKLRIEHLNCFRKSSFNKEEIYKQYRNIIKSKLKTNYKF